MGLRFATARYVLILVAGALASLQSGGSVPPTCSVEAYDEVVAGFEHQLQVSLDSGGDRSAVASTDARLDRYIDGFVAGCGEPASL